MRAEFWRLGATPVPVAEIGRIARRLDTALEAAARSEQNLSETLERAGAIIIATDAEGRLTLVNSAWSRLTGWPAAEALGRRLAKGQTLADEISQDLAPVDEAADEGSHRS